MLRLNVLQTPALVSGFMALCKFGIISKLLLGVSICLGA